LQPLERVVELLDDHAGVFLAEVAPLDAGAVQNGLRVKRVLLLGRLVLHVEDEIPADTALPELTAHVVLCQLLDEDAEHCLLFNEGPRPPAEGDIDAIRPAGAVKVKAGLPIAVKVAVPYENRSIEEEGLPPLPPSLQVRDVKHFLPHCAEAP